MTHAKSLLLRCAVNTCNVHGVLHRLVWFFKPDEPVLLLCTVDMCSVQSNCAFMRTAVTNHAYIRLAWHLLTKALHGKCLVHCIVHSCVRALTCAPREYSFAFALGIVDACHTLCTVTSVGACHMLCTVTSLPYFYISIA